MTSSDGRTYYHNQRTNQTSWERPAELDAPAPRGGRGDATVDEAKLTLRADAERDGDNAQHDPSGSHENDP